MLKPPPDLKVFLFLQAMDMRCGFDRLAALVQEKLQRSVLAGGMFVFFCRNRKKVKLLWWDRDGYALFYNYPSSYYTSFGCRLAS